MTESRMQFLENVNTELKKMVQLAETDFVAVNTLLKTYYSNRAIVATDSKAIADAETKMEAMMGGLQYMDVFSQRVSHLVSTHNQMLSNDLAQNFADSFFHLHVFQSMTIELDLLQSISSIKSLLVDIIDHVDSLKNTSDPFFGNTPLIKQTLQRTIDTLLQAGGETAHLPIPSLAATQVAILNSLYTMESERIVLNWFLNSMPTGTWENLLEYYELEIHQTAADNTELF